MDSTASRANMSPASQQLKLVIFDWAGTTVDHGCFAPIAAFVQTFARRRVDVSVAQVRGPMGLHKREHIRAISKIPEVATQWREIHGSECSEQDVDSMFADDFVPMQLDAAQSHSELVPGLLTCLEQLRQRQLRIASTTGYFRQAAELVYATADQQGYRPDYTISAEEVPAGRPAPWMIYRCMEALDAYPPASVVKVGDTVPDVQAGRNAGVWSIGVTHTGSEVGCTQQELADLAAHDRQARIEEATHKLRSAGAHFVIDSVADLPQLLPELERRLVAGEGP